MSLVGLCPLSCCCCVFVNHLNFLLLPFAFFLLPPHLRNIFEWVFWECRKVSSNSITILRLPLFTPSLFYSFTKILLFFPFRISLRAFRIFVWSQFFLPLSFLSPSLSLIICCWLYSIWSKWTLNSSWVSPVCLFNAYNPPLPSPLPLSLASPSLSFTKVVMERLWDDHFRNWMQTEKPIMRMGKKKLERGRERAKGKNKKVLEMKEM